MQDHKLGAWPPVAIVPFSPGVGYAKPVEKLQGEYSVLDESVRFDIHFGTLRLTVGTEKWSIPVSEFSSDELSYIREIIATRKEGSKQLPHACRGCFTIPSYGFGSQKYNWCSFSRTIARLQEEYVSTPVKLPKISTTATAAIATAACITTSTTSATSATSTTSATATTGIYIPNRSSPYPMTSDAKEEERWSFTY